MKTLVMQPIRTLNNIFGASGLVKIENTFYVIADDDLFLGIIEEEKETLVALIPGILPTDHKERKKVKPDWEALAQVPSKDSSVELLAVPSGSKPNRFMGSFIALNDDGVISMQIDFSKIYSSLLKTFPNLNIEGACFTEKYLQLFQRGNGSDAKNALINLDLEAALKDIRSTQALAEDRIHSIKEFSQAELGEAAGIPLSFTDVCYISENETWFLAVAEGGGSTYEDGAFVGAVLGIIDMSGKISEVFNLEVANKPEGLSVEIGASNERIVHVVTDADSSEIPAVLFRTIINRL